MRKKQIQEIACRIYQLENELQELYSQKEENRNKKKILEKEKEISKISNQILCLPNGLEIMIQIDEILSKKLTK